MLKVISLSAICALLTCPTIASDADGAQRTPHGSYKRDAAGMAREERTYFTKSSAIPSQVSRWFKMSSLLNNMASETLNDPAQFYTNILKARGIGRTIHQTNPTTYTMMLQKVAESLGLQIIAQPMVTDTLCGRLIRLRTLLKTLNFIQSDEVVKEVSLLPLMIMVEYKLYLSGRARDIDREHLMGVSKAMFEYGRRVRDSGANDILASSYSKILEICTTQGWALP